MRVKVVAVLTALSIVFGVARVSSAGTSDGLVLHRPLGAGVASGEVHGVLPAEDRFGNSNAALRFDGVDDWIGLEGLDCSLNFDRDWSVSLWVSLDGSGKHTVFFAGADGDAGARQFVLASHFVKMSHKADTNSDWRVNFEEVPHDSWHLYTATWDKKGVLTVYVDGVLQGEDRQGELADFCPKNDPIIGGVNFYRKSQFFKGRLDDFRVYDRVLPPADIEALFVEQQ